MKKDPIIYLEHMVECISKIEMFVGKIGKDQFFKDELRKSAVLREITLIGESAKNIPIDYTKKYPQIPWKDINGARDKLIHNYLGIDYEIIWQIIDREIPKLKKELKLVIKKEKT